MKYILIILIVAAYGGYFGSMLSRPIDTKDIIGTILLIGLSVFCSRYLYKNENKNKIEWALFGFLGNVSALFYHWVYRLFTAHWKKGKTVTGNN
jgi:hypothetical protein